MHPRAGAGQPTPVALVAQKTFPYAGRSIDAGRPFLARSEHDAKALTAAGLAVLAPTPSDTPQ